MPTGSEATKKFKKVFCSFRLHSSSHIVLPAYVKSLIIQATTEINDFLAFINLKYKRETIEKHEG